jgi:hypothetical protein
MKYLLCRPRGGINDTLNQIEKCWRYAEVYNRILIIDTEYLISTGISVEFSKLFEPKQHYENVYFNLTLSSLCNLNQLSVFPASCAGRLDKYQTRLDENFRQIDKDTGSRLTFDFNKNYVEDLLLHDQFGAGTIGIDCLARLKFSEQFKLDVLNMLYPLLGKSHIGLHVRHTDYQTNYIHAFKKIYDKTINQRVLLCSDSIEVKNFAKKFFDQSDFISLSMPPDTVGFGIPTYATFHCNQEQRYNLMVQAFSDLLGLAKASQTIFCELSLGKFSNAASQHQDFATYATAIQNSPTKKIGINGLSGFSFFAASLKKNTSIINQLFSDSNWYRGGYNIFS